MQKILLLGWLFWLCAYRSEAQLPNGAIAPDFVGTDLNGKTWRLYDLLAAGKVVILDISATWCPPCWIYHNSGALKKVYQDYGPTGTQEIMVLFVEGDPNTSTACLYGDLSCPGGTLGNWVSNTPYPIIDDDRIAKLYEINYFPTIFCICPNRRLVELGQLQPAGLYAFAKKCPISVGVNNAGIFKTHTGLSGDIFCGETYIQPTVEFQNLGSANITSAELSLTINDLKVQTTTWSGNLATFEIGKLSFAPQLLTEEDFVDIEFTIEKINGLPDENATDNTNITVLLHTNQIVEDNTVVLELRTDNRPMETYWELRNKAGNVLYSGGNPAATPGGLNPNLTGGYGSNLLIKKDLFLPRPDCYEFYILDDGANGLANNAYFTISDKAGNTLVEYVLFEKEYSSWFRAQNFQVGTTHFDADGLLTIQPNPARDECAVSWNSDAFRPEHFFLTDVNGRMLRQGAIGTEQHFFRMSLDDLPVGVLMLHLVGEQGRVSARIVRWR